MTPQEILEKAVSLEEGSTMIVPCYSKQQQESLRVGLSFNKKKLPETDFEILVSTGSNEAGEPIVILSKVKRITSAIVVSKEGEVSTISLSKEEAE